jgi:uncharacterized RDD family membrane protein YckC
LVVVALVGVPELGRGDTSFNLLVLGVFVVEAAVLVPTMGGSFGQLVTRLRVVRVDGGGHVDLLRSVVRAVLVALVVPPLVFKPDGRGLHDLAAGSATVTLETARRGSVGLP